MQLATWPSGKAEACKAFTTGSNPVVASILNYQGQHMLAVLFYIICFMQRCKADLKFVGSLLYRRNLMPTQFLKSLKKIDVSALVVTVIIVVACAAGKYTLETIFNQNTLPLGISSKFAQLFFWLAIGISLYFAIRFMYKCIDSQKQTSSPEQKSFYEIAKSVVPKVMIVLCICWLPYLIFRFPGNIDPDTLWQIMQTYGLATASDHHPWFDTLLFSGFWQIGDLFGTHAISLLLYALLQYAATALAFALVIAYCKYIDAHPVFTKLTVIFFAVYPMISLYAMTMTKDCLFGFLWIYYLLIFYEAARTRGQVFKNKKYILLFAVFSILLMLTKKTGIYLVILSCIGLLFVINKKFRGWLIIAVISPALVYVILWEGIYLPACGIKAGSGAEMMSLPSQQVAYYMQQYGDEMAEDDWGVLNHVFFVPEVLPEVYSPGRADDTKSQWNYKASKRDKLNFFIWYAGKMIQHPKTFVLAALANTLPAYYPDKYTEDDESLVFYRDNLESAADKDQGFEELLLGYSDGKATEEDISKLLDGAYRNPSIARASDALDSCLLSFMQDLVPLFAKCMFCWWAPLISAFYCIRKRSGVGIVVLLPTFIAFLTIIAGPVVLPRYLIPFVYSLPLILLPMFAPKFLSGLNGLDNDQ